MKVAIGIRYRFEMTSKIYSRTNFGSLVKIHSHSIKMDRLKSVIKTGMKQNIDWYR